MKRYKCKKSFCVDKYDDDGFLIENSSVVIDKGKIYEFNDSDHTIIGGEIHLEHGLKCRCSDLKLIFSSTIYTHKSRKTNAILEKSKFF